ATTATTARIRATSASCRRAPSPAAPSRSAIPWTRPATGCRVCPAPSSRCDEAPDDKMIKDYRLNHLKQLEAESIHIIREVAAEFERPVMMYSIGKDSSVMLHLAMKAFHPGKLPFPLLHVDTTWKFRDMIRFRDETAKRLGLELIVHVNQEGVKA